MIKKIKELDTEETLDDCLDVIYEWVDDLCYAGDWDTINETLRSINVEEWSVTVLLAFLVTAYPAASHLVDGTDFFNRVEAKFLRDEGKKRAQALTSRLQFKEFTTNHCGHPRCPTCKDK